MENAAVSSASLYNTARRKLMEGKPVIGGTIHSNDPEIYRAVAGAGFDFLWIEMQHSPLGYTDVARMIWAGRGYPAIPFIRVPDATEGDIQKATDAGALGIVVPMVDTPDKARAAVSFAKYPPAGRRSYGNQQGAALWGEAYRRTFNDNLVVVAMIETPEGVAAAREIAAVEGVDVVFAASADLSSFSGLPKGHPDYEAMVEKIRDATLGAGKRLGGPLAWRGRPGFTFFQGPPETALIHAGAATLGLPPR
jgi:2-keto-3-deoxy-L-rhamnonate aldolase RhmA